MLFHVGTLWRLNELGWLKRLNRVSSVSGGSITAGVLGLAWTNLDFGPNGVARRFVDLVVNPVRKLAGISIDVKSILTGILLPFISISERVEAAYREHLFEAKTLQDLPSDSEGPRFVFNATNVQTGALFRFSKPFFADYRLGLVRNPAVPLAKVVTASSAFPPVLSPMKLSLRGLQFEAGTGQAGYEDFRAEAVLTDGGVYDNMGLETAWKRYKTVLISDAGAKMPPELSPRTDWVRHGVRVLDIIDSQVRSLRKRIAIDAFRTGLRGGTYFGITSDVAQYPAAGAFAAPHERTLELARIATRLSAMPEDAQKLLINWGYVICDAAMRSHVTPQAVRPQALPYPDSPLSTLHSEGIGSKLG